MIKYNIDKSELAIAQSNQTTVVMTITGWVCSDTATKVDISLITDAPYKVSMFIREDIDALFHEDKKNKYSGFSVEVGVYKDIDEISCVFAECGGEQQTAKETIKVSSRKFLTDQLKVYAKDIKHNNKMDLLAAKKHVKKNLFVLAGSINGKSYYNMDEIIYLNTCREVIIRGWQIALEGENKLDFEDGVIDFEKTFERPDVKKLFDREAFVENNGFDYRIKMKDTDTFVLRIANDQAGTMKVCIPIDSINGSEYDVKAVLSKKEQKEYNLKYGEEGTKLKKREREIFYQESVMNTKPYINNRTPDILHPVSDCDLSIIVAVNSRLYLEKTDLFFKQLKADGIQVLYAGKPEMFSDFEVTGYDMETVACMHEDKEALCLEAYKRVKNTYVMFLDQEDFFDCDYPALLKEKFESGYDLIYSDYDLVYDSKGIVRVNRIPNFLEKENSRLALTACVFRKNCVGLINSFKDIVDKLKENAKSYHNETVMYHYNVVEDAWNQEQTKAVAFYLTQYHITEENNKWWGEGFTEWKNVKRGKPMFEDHDQPRIPTDLGYYDLVEDRSVQYKQVELAKKFGVYGFCYYYYWFEGKRLLRKPLDQFVENHELDLPYCICWANETWSKRWDGMEHEILMQQVHNEQTDRDFIYDIIPMLKDERYIKIDGKPILLIYRFDLFPYPNKTIQLWRDICRKEGVGEIHIAIVQAFDAIDHRIYGADSSVEFPPHKYNAIPDICINDEILKDDSAFKGSVYSYKRIVENISTIEKRDYELYPGSMLKWDNTARRMENAHVFCEFTPELYRHWLIKNSHYTKLYNNEKVMFINAWNEWAEGSYLEPDQTYGTELLEITNEVTRYK